MCFFKKRKTTMKANEADREIVKANVGLAGVVEVYIKELDDAAITERFAKIKVELESFFVSPKEGVRKVDHKIGSKLQDLKLDLSGKKRDAERVNAALLELDVAIAERKAAYNAK